MNAFCLFAALLCGASPVSDGSLLFLENSNRAVEYYTHSDTSHVAIVLNEKETPWVYEATPREVRKVTLDAYYAEIGVINQERRASRKIQVKLVSPAKEYSPEQVEQMREWLDSQMGRRYSIKAYVRGSSDGIHCAELASKSLCSAKALDIAHCERESPGTLLAKVEPLSHKPVAVAIAEPTERPTWCQRQRAQYDSICTWCSWSCGETWSWCW